MNHPLGKDFRYLDVQAAMTFEEIGQRLGISKKLAWTTYARAIAKIRRRKEALRRLQELVSARDRGVY